MDVEYEKKPLGLLCNSSSWGGLEMNVLALAKRMSARGWPVVIYGREDSTLAEFAQTSGVRFSHLRSEFKFGDVLNARRLARALERDGVTALINNLGSDIFLSTLAKRFCKTPLRLFYYQHMQLGMDKRDAFHSWLYKQLDGWLAPLPGFVTSLQEKTTFDVSKAHVIPFGVDMERFTADAPEKPQARATLDLPQDAFIAGVVGRLDPKKGQLTLIEALALLHAKYSNLHILILGDRTHGEHETYEQTLRQRAQQLGIGARVHFRPHRKDVETAYAALDVFAMTSESETYGMVTLEAMASGVPVIGTNAGGTRELIEDGVTGLLYEYEDAGGLAGGLSKLLQDSALPEKLAKNARERVAQEFTYQRQCQLLEEALAG